MGGWILTTYFWCKRQKAKRADKLDKMNDTLNKMLGNKKANKGMRQDMPQFESSNTNGDSDVFINTRRRCIFLHDLKVIEPESKVQHVYENKPTHTVKPPDENIEQSSIFNGVLVLVWFATCYFIYK